MDEKLSIFVTNLRAYNEGRLVGGWLELPSPPEETVRFMRDVVGIGKTDPWGQPYEEAFITDYDLTDWTAACGLNEYIDLHSGAEYVPVESLDLLARTWERYGNEQALAAMAVYTKDEGCNSLDEMCNLIIQSDDLHYTEYTHNRGDAMERFGGTVVEVWDPDLDEALRKSGTRQLFDFERYGREVLAQGDFSYGPEGYIHAEPGFDLELLSHDEIAERVLGPIPEEPER